VDDHRVLANLRRSVALVVGLSSALALLASCGASTRTVTWVGAVTTLTPHLCVGRHAALGDCFTTDNSGPVANLQIGDCVVVAFSTNAAEGAEGGDILLPNHVTPNPASNQRLIPRCTASPLRAVPVAIICAVAI
jgi:hypothetical protein